MEHDSELSYQMHLTRNILPASSALFLESCVLLTLRPLLCMFKMPPIRRYLRITKYSVLECRIYLDNPADGPRWLLSPRNPALPRIIQSVKPLVLPKLREERERAKEKGKKTKSVKDVVVEGKFSSRVYKHSNPISS